MLDFKYCPGCGKRSPQLTKFCDSCGYGFSGFSSPAKAQRFTARHLGIIWLAAAVFGVVLILVGLRHPVGLSSTPLPHENPTQLTATKHIGDTAIVAEGHGYWPCGSSREALDEMLKWYARKDEAEIKRTMGRTRSIGIVGGMRVKIIDSGFGERKVRVLTNDAGESVLRDEKGSFPADPRIGRECWVVSEAVGR
jgi:hypothetical protein